MKKLNAKDYEKETEKKIKELRYDLIMLEQEYHRYKVLKEKGVQFKFHRHPITNTIHYIIVREVAQ